MPMCLGVPMQVVATGQGWADCRNGDEVRRIDTLLLDGVAVDDWVLVHVSSAMRSLEPAEAIAIRDALLAVQNAVAGRPFEHLLADLVDREPQLPPHLRPGGA
jgi:hydrogenase expression/formation protein HypC